jgi:hypothetical protein
MKLIAAVSATKQVQTLGLLKPQKILVGNAKTIALNTFFVLTVGQDFSQCNI